MSGQQEISRSNPADKPFSALQSAMERNARSSAVTQGASSTSELGRRIQKTQ